MESLSTTETAINKETPQLRFPEFDGKYENKKLKEIGKFIGGGTPKTDNDEFWNGDIPWISSSDVYENDIHKIYISRYVNHSSIKHSATKKIPPQSILMVSRVGIGKFAVNEDTVTTSQDFTNLVTKNSNPYFLAYYFSARSDKFLSLSQGTSIKGFTSKDAQNLSFKIPSLSEQQKIANFLTQVDRKIELLDKQQTALEQYKKGVMQKIFNQEIRFEIKNEAGELVKPPEWEEKKLGELIREKNEKTKTTDQHPLLSSTKRGIFNQNEYFKNQVASKNNTGYKILRKNELVLSPQNLWLGNINLNFKYELGIVSPSYKIFEINNSLTSAVFCSYFMFTPRMFHEYAEASEQGASVVRRNLDIDLFKSIKIKLPSIKEQTKIANFLSAIDTKIEAVAERSRSHREWKKGLLQKMFV